MPETNESARAALLLAQRLIDTTATALKASEYWRLLTQVPDPASLVGLDAAAITNLGLSSDLAERIVTLLDAATAVSFHLDELEQSGVRALSSFDDCYPSCLVDRLGPTAPPTLFVAGDAGLLTGDALGIVGSRDVAPAGAEAAQTAAREAARRGVTVVSGGAKGVDRLAMTAALDAGGTAIGVLADSLIRTTRDPDVRRAIHDGTLCLCTPYKPTAGFSVAYSMGRNKLIYALSRATFVVASDHNTGGTWAGAVEALKLGIAPVVVWTGDGSGPGNRALIDRGGAAVDDAAGVLDAPVTPTPPSPSAAQLAFDV